MKHRHQLKSVFICIIIGLCSLSPVVFGESQQTQTMRREIASQEGRFLKEHLKQHLKGMGLVEPPNLSIKINPKLRASALEGYELDQLIVFVSVYGNFGPNFRRHIEKYIIRTYESLGYASADLTTKPRVEAFVQIKEPKLPHYASYLIGAASILLFFGAITLLWFSAQRLRFIRIVHHKGGRLQNINSITHLHEPEIGLLKEDNLDVQARNLLFIENLFEDTFATACAIKIAEVCELQLKYGKGHIPHEMQVGLKEIEYKLNTMTLAEAINVLSKLDKETKIEALKRMRLTPVLMASLLKR